MIKANELRIGILIRDYRGAVRKVTGRDIYKQCALDGDREDQSVGPVLNPIPLTPEWLERMGFEKFGNRYGLGDESIDFGIDQENSFFYWNQSEIPDVQLKYVHQLQNLYFALTGEELTIKEA